MPLPTNYTVTGTNFRIQTQLGEWFENGSFAIVQWTHPYQPRYRPLNEWTSTNLTMVNWVGNYQSTQGVPTFTSQSFQVYDPGALYIYIDFGNSSNATPSMYGQAWLGQITDTLTLPGGEVNIDLNTATIRPMMGDMSGNILRAQDFNSWTPQAVPEPSYAWFAVVLFGLAVFMKSRKEVAK